ncbi:MAG: (Fe-S)-binding protein [bacterium]
MRSLLDILLDQAVGVATNCLECGRCLYSCEFSSFGKSGELAKQVVRASNAAVKNGGALPREVAALMKTCHLCGRCDSACPENLPRSAVNTFCRLQLRPTWAAKRANHLGFLNRLWDDLKILLTWPFDLKRWYLKIGAVEDSGGLLVYHGCYAKITPQICQQFEHILDMAGVDFNSLGGSDNCCGGVLLYRGFGKLADKKFRKLAQTIESVEPRRIVTHCGHCYKMLKSIVSELRLKSTVIHTTELILELIVNGKINLYPIGAPIAIHDACHLRHLAFPPRSIISMIGDVRDGSRYLERSVCCGYTTRPYNPLAVEEIVEERIEELWRTKADIICTICPLCYESLRSNMGREKFRVEIIDIIDLVSAAMGIL